jgi:hypothetical protein
MRFRTYLGEQYKRLDTIETKKGKKEKALPIVCIFILGFTISKIDSKALRVNRTYTDIIDKKEFNTKSKFIESLTHDGYFVQVPRITGNLSTTLEQMLSLFEQQNFKDDKNTIKDYSYKVENEIIKEMLSILQYVAADPECRRSMEEEWFENLNDIEYERVLKELHEKDLEIKQKEDVISENEKIISEKDNVISEKDRELSEKDKENEELRKLLKQAGIKIP